MDVTASQGYGAGAAIRGMRAYARQTAFSAFSAKTLGPSPGASSPEVETPSSPEAQSAPRTRSFGFRLGPLAIRYTTEEPEVAPGVTWDDLVSEAERLASYETTYSYATEREVAELRSSLAEEPLERLSRLMGEAPRQDAAAGEASSEQAPSASMRKAAAAYAGTAVLGQGAQPGALWSAVL